MKNFKKALIAVLAVIIPMGFTACVANNENKIGDFKDTRNIDLPAEDNGYVVKVHPGETAIIDLNGDGENDIINYTLQQSDSTNYGNDAVKSLTISGEEFAKENSDNPLGSLGVQIFYPDNQWYFIVDIDAYDSYREIAIADLGPSDDLTTSFFRYDGEKLEYIGYVTGFPTDEGYSMNGKGEIHSKGRLALLQYWTATFTWRLNEVGKLLSVKEDLYYPDKFVVDEEKPILLKEKLMVYKDRDLSSETMLMEPSEEGVTFPITDNENWVLLRMADGSEGWFYVRDRIIIVSQGKELDSSQVFENLYYAD